MFFNKTIFILHHMVYTHQSGHWIFTPLLAAQCYTWLSKLPYFKTLVRIFRYNFYFRKINFFIFIIENQISLACIEISNGWNFRVDIKNYIESLCTKNTTIFWNLYKILTHSLRINQINTYSLYLTWHVARRMKCWYS